MGQALCGSPFSSVGSALTPGLEAPEGESPLFESSQDHPQRSPRVATSSGSQAGLALVAWLVDSASELGLPSVGPLTWWRAWAEGLFQGGGASGGLSGHSSLSPAGNESRCVLGTAAVRALWPEIGPCLHGASTAPYGSLLAALCPPVPSSSCRQMSCQCRVFLPLSLSSARALGSFQDWKGPSGHRAGWGSRCGHVRGCCMGFSVSLC